MPLREQSSEDPLDAAFLAGIKEELASIEENEKNIQALSQVFRYYAKHAKQLSQVLFDFATQQCFPWELIHAMHLVDDILLMDNSGRYKVEFRERVRALASHSFRKVQSEKEKREVARMLHAWQELKIFDASVLEAIRAQLRQTSAAAARILEEVDAAGGEDEEEEEEAVAAAAAGSPAGEAAPAPKRQRLVEATSLPAGRGGAAEVPGEARPPPAPRGPSVERVLALVARILSSPLEQPFALLGIAEDGANGHDIRKAYRRIALLIHPDKNPGMEAKCQEALVKLQQGREQAEAELQRLDGGDGAVRVGETRSAATAAAANAGVDAAFKCRHPDCDLPPCKQCANGCCTRNITHCHMMARSKAGQQCFFHPPPRAWARNA